MYDINPTDNRKTISLKLYHQISRKYSELFTDTVFCIYEHIRINARQDKHLFNTCHSKMAEILQIDVETLKKHLKTLCLVGLFSRNKQGWGNYWYNYVINDQYEQEKIETTNKDKIAAQIDKIKKNRNRMTIINHNKRDLMVEITRLKTEIVTLKTKISQLEQRVTEQDEKVFELTLDKQEVLFLLKENGVDTRDK